MHIVLAPLSRGLNPAVAAAPAAQIGLDRLKWNTDREVAARQTGASLSQALEITLTPTSHSPASRAPGVSPSPLSPGFHSICPVCTQTCFWYESMEDELQEKGEKVYIFETITAKTKGKRWGSHPLVAAAVAVVGGGVQGKRWLIWAKDIHHQETQLQSSYQPFGMNMTQLACTRICTLFHLKCGVFKLKSN